MNPKECVFAYDRLILFLREHRYGWIVSEVEETIALGSIRAGRADDYEGDAQVPYSEAFGTPREVVSRFDAMKVLDNDEFRLPVAETNTSARPRRGRRIEIQKVEEFSPADRLRILLTAISRVFIGMPDMETSTAAILKRIGPQITAAVIEDERSDNPTSIDLLAGGKRRAHVDTLTNALDRLKEMSK